MTKEKRKNLRHMRETAFCLQRNGISLIEKSRFAQSLKALS